MPEGPNKSEERLQRYAKQRREESKDFSLHPATRRLLQGEAARQFGAQTKEKNARRSRNSLWRVFAFGTAVAALVVVSWSFWTSGTRSKRMELAEAKLSPKSVVTPRNEIRSDTAPIADTAARAQGVSPSEPAREVRRAESRQLALDGVVEKEVGRKLNANTNSLPLAQNAQSTSGLRNYATDLSYAAPQTDALSSAVSITSQDKGIVQGPVLRGQLELSGAGNAPPAARGIAPAQAAAAGGSVLLTESANQFSQTPTRQPQVALRSENEQLKRLQEVSELSNKPLAPATLAVTVPGQPQKTEAPVSGAAPEQLAAAASPSQTFFRESDPTFSFQERARSDALGKQTKETSLSEQVLSRFSIEQRGKDVYLVDFDGSRYDIEFDRPQNEAGFKDELARDSNRFGIQAGKDADLKQKDANATEYSFRATGSNMTLRQSVVVDGRLRRAIVRGDSPEQQLRAESQAALTKSPAPTAAPSPVKRNPGPRSSIAHPTAVDPTNSVTAIEGTVRIGRTNVQRFRALSGSR